MKDSGQVTCMHDCFEHVANADSQALSFPSVNGIMSMLTVKCEASSAGKSERTSVSAKGKLGFTVQLRIVESLDGESKPTTVVATSGHSCS